MITNNEIIVCSVMCDVYACTQRITSVHSKGYFDIHVWYFTRAEY